MSGIATGESGESEYSGMKKAKATSKRTVRKPAKRSSSKNKKPKDQAEARKTITDMVRARSNEMAKAVAVEGLKGQLAPVRYLFEVTGLFPSTAETEAQPEEDSLARTLLNHMGISVVAGETDDSAKPSEKPDSQSSNTKLVESVPPREVADAKGRNSGPDETAKFS